jgi:hypothetical protein
VKKVIIVFVLMFVCCSNRIDNAKATDCGAVKIGPNLYLKKVMIGDDKIYLMVNEQSQVVAGTSTNYTVTTGKTSHDINTTTR